MRSIGACYEIPRYDVNGNNNFVDSLDINVDFLAVYILISLFILVVSIIIIYSIFYISIMNKIKQFGQLITLGTTEKQIIKMV